MVPGQVKAIFVISAQKFSVQHQFQELQLQELPSCVSMGNRISNTMCNLGHELDDKINFVFTQLRVEALSSQETFMNEEQKQSVFTSFIYRFLSRVDLPGTRATLN